jgi:hypothetical protein
VNVDAIITAACGDSFSKPTWSQSCMRWIDEAQRKIARRVAFDDRFSTVTIPVLAGATTATLVSDPTTLERIESVNWVTSSGFPIALDPTDLDHLETYQLADTGLPDVYSKLGGGIEFRPATDAAGTIRARVVLLPPSIVSTNDVPVLHVDYHDMLVTFCRARLFREEEDLQMHDALMTQFETEMQRLKTDVQGANEDGPSQIEGTF